MPCPVIQRFVIVTQNCSSLNLNVAKWWFLIIHAQANLTIPHDIQRPDGCMPGSKEECVTIQVKPDRSNMRTPIFSHRCQLSSPNLLHQKISMFVRQLIHVDIPFHLVANALSASYNTTQLFAYLSRTDACAAQAPRFTTCDILQIITVNQILLQVLTNAGKRSSSMGLEEKP